MVKIYIVDDHQVFRDGVKALVKYQEGIEVVGSVGTIQEFMNEIEHVEVDVILMDISIGDEEDGIVAIKWIKEKNPNARVLILSMHDEGEYIEKGLRAGARGYVLKDVDSEEIMIAIRTVADGGSFYSQKISNTMVQQLYQMNSGDKLLKNKKLTPRELEVLILIVEENSNSEIAAKLFISTRTVDTHRRNILDKLKVRNTVGLVKYAIRQGIVKV